MKIGCAPPGPLRCHWPDWKIRLLPGPAAVHEDPSGLPRQPAGATCGEQVPGTRRGGSLAHPGGRAAGVRGSRSTRFKIQAPQAVLLRRLDGLRRI